jgi:hypothetical protein
LEAAKARKLKQVAGASSQKSSSFKSPREVCKVTDIYVI